MVIDDHLKRQGTHYLIVKATTSDQNISRKSTFYLSLIFLLGDKPTYADLAFIPWFEMLPNILMPASGGDLGASDQFTFEYPLYSRWIEDLMERDAVKKVYNMPVFMQVYAVPGVEGNEEGQRLIWRR